jgi:hypothetical protein
MYAATTSRCSAMQRLGFLRNRQTTGAGATRDRTAGHSLPASGLSTVPRSRAGGSLRKSNAIGGKEKRRNQTREND